METLIAVFIGVAAVAFLLQSLALWALSRSMQNLSLRVEGLSKDLVRNVDALSGKADKLLSTASGIADKIGVMQESLAATTAIVHKRVVDLDAFLDEATKTARLQIIRIQDMVQTTSRRVEDTVGTLQRGVLAPVTEVHALMAGVRVGLKYMLGRRKRPSSRSLQDEEMFI